MGITDKTDLVMKEKKDSPIQRISWCALAKIFFIVGFLFAAQHLRAQIALSNNQTGSSTKYELPADGVLIEEQPLGAAGHPDKALILWMIKPEKHPTDYKPDDPYTCPDYTRGSHYTGRTRVSLADRKNGKVINTIEIKREYDNGE